MLTIAEVSGLIAAGVMLVQYALPATLVLILFQYLGTSNTAVTWSVVNQTISNTIWPHLVRADTVSTRGVARPAVAISWTMSFGAFLLVVSSVLAPLGLSEEVVPGESAAMEFQYVPDTSTWGRATMPRPDMPFTRICEVGTNINCPGQYQGVYMEETDEGVFESVKTDEESTINTTIPANFTEMFYSKTSTPGSTLSGLFDIQYRRWKFDQADLFDKGAVHTEGDFRNLEGLITQTRVLLKEGIVVDMTDTPGVGFRNHTAPVGLDLGGTWSEDITWLEPVTRCADTNLSIDISAHQNPSSFSPQIRYFLVDRGAFANLNVTDLQTRPWNDNQTLDLDGRAYLAARMTNVLAALDLNLTLPRGPNVEKLPRMRVPKDMAESNYLLFPPGGADLDTIALNEFAGLYGAFGDSPRVRDPSYVPYYEDGHVKLFAKNHSAISQICRGYYELDESGADRRANNITYPMVECGMLVGAGVLQREEGQPEDTAVLNTTHRRDVYTCATGLRATIKTLEFRYNDTGSDLLDLNVTSVKDKAYPDEESKPLWAVEHSEPFRMRLDPLWGLVTDEFRDYGGFYSLRAEKLWLPTTPHLTLSFGSFVGYDALAAASSPVRQLGSLYNTVAVDGRDYSGKHEYPLAERFNRLSREEKTASLIPSLILNDELAMTLIGTKTAISTRGSPWPATLAADNTGRGAASALVTRYERVIRYDLRFAIPSFIVLAIFLVSLFWATGLVVFSRSLITQIRNTYNQTSAGRLATGLTASGKMEHNKPTTAWVSQEGKQVLTFGEGSTITTRKGHFSQIIDHKEEIHAGEYVELKDLVSLADKASQCREEGRWHEAEEAEAQVYQRRRGLLGANHPDTLTSMNNLAFVFGQMGRMEEARSMMRECLALRGSVLGPKHPDTVVSERAVEMWQ